MITVICMPINGEISAWASIRETYNFKVFSIISIYYVKQFNSLLIKQIDSVITTYFQFSTFTL